MGPCTNLREWRKVAANRFEKIQRKFFGVPIRIHRHLPEMRAATGCTKAVLVTPRIQSSRDSGGSTQPNIRRPDKGHRAGTKSTAAKAGQGRRKGRQAAGIGGAAKEIGKAEKVVFGKVDERTRERKSRPFSSSEQARRRRAPPPRRSSSPGAVSPRRRPRGNARRTKP